MNLTLKPCPCGYAPKRLVISDAGQGGKWANASCEYCGEWTIEFRTQHNKLESDECYRLAVEDWNDAPRGIYSE